MASTIDHNGSNNLINSFKIYHQNMGGLRKKINELIVSLSHSYPHVLCLTEHHLRYNELDVTSIQHYNLATSFCGNKFKKSGCKYFGP